MRSRGALLAASVAIAVLATAATTVRVELAEAQGAPPFEKLRNGTATQAEKDYWQKVLRGTYRGTVGDQIVRSVPPADRRGILGRLYRARVGARLLPLAARLTLLGTGIYVGWTIYQHFADGSKRTVDMWLDSAAFGRDALFNIAEALAPEAYSAMGGHAEYSWDIADWEYRSGVSQSYCPAVFGANPCARMRLRVSMVPPISSWADEVPYPVYDVVAPEPGAIGTAEAFTTWQWPDLDLCIAAFADCFGGGGGARPIAYGRHAIEAATLTQLRVSDGRAIGGAPAVRVQTHPATSYDSGPLFGVYITESQWRAIVTPDSEVFSPGTTGTNPSPDHTSTYNVPADQGTPADEDAALDAMDDECGRSFVNAAIEPGVYSYPPGCVQPEEPPASPDTFTLPQPLVGETYADYIVRLQEEGWVGQATRVDLSEAEGDPALGPEGIVRLRVRPLNGSQVTLLTRSWPAVGPEVAIDAPIRLEVNPETYAPVPGGGGVPGGPPGGRCNGFITAKLDLSPILGLRCGDVFPFGVFVWLGDLWGSLADQPEECMEFDVPFPEGVSAGPLHVSMCSALWEDTYRDPVFLALQFLLTVAMVWWFAFRILGLGE